MEPSMFRNSIMCLINSKPHHLLTYDVLFKGGGGGGDSGKNSSLNLFLKVRKKNKRDDGYGAGWGAVFTIQDNRIMKL